MKAFYCFRYQPFFQFFFATVSLNSLGQVCETVKDGQWEDPTVWSCTAASAPIGSGGAISTTPFSGTLIIRHQVTIGTDRSNNDTRELVMSGYVFVDVQDPNGSVKLSQNNSWRFQNVASQIILRTQKTTVSGSNNTNIYIGNCVYNGPFQGSNTLKGYQELNIVNCQQALPVEFTQFGGKTFANSVQLYWETVWERNADLFVVERSRNLKEFFSVGSSIRAKGHSDTRNRYTFEDKTPFPGANYYRLRQIDKDGTINFSKIISVVVNADQEALLAYQSAENGDIRVLLNAIQVKGIRLMNIVGKIISTQAIHLADTEWVIRPAAPLTPGVYLIAVNSDTGPKRVKFLAR